MSKKSQSSAAPAPAAPSPAPAAESLVIPAAPAPAPVAEAKPAPAPTEPELAIPAAPAEPPPVTIDEKPVPAAPVVILTDAMVEKVEAEVTTNGSVSPETIAEFESKGIPSKFILEHIEMKQKLNTQARTSQATEIKAAVGGEEAWREIQTWAAANVPEAGKAAFAKTVASGDTDAIKLAVLGLQSQMRAKQGYDPASPLNGNQRPAGVAAFESQAQMIQAMQDPRYAKDPAYREKVIKRIEAMR